MKEKKTYAVSNLRPYLGESAYSAEVQCQEAVSLSHNQPAQHLGRQSSVAVSVWGLKVLDREYMHIFLSLNLSDT